MAAVGKGPHFLQKPPIEFSGYEPDIYFFLLIITSDLQINDHHHHLQPRKIYINHNKKNQLENLTKKFKVTLA